MGARRGKRTYPGTFWRERSRSWGSDRDAIEFKRSENPLRIRRKSQSPPTTTTTTGNYQKPMGQIHSRRGILTWPHAGRFSPRPQSSVWWVPDQIRGRKQAEELDFDKKKIFRRNAKIVNARRWREICRFPEMGEFSGGFCRCAGIMLFLKCNYGGIVNLSSGLSYSIYNCTNKLSTIKNSLGCCEGRRIYSTYKVSLKSNFRRT